MVMGFKLGPLYITRLPKKYHKIYLNKEGLSVPPETEDAQEVLVPSIYAVHPEWKKKVQFAFTLGKKDYYEFATLLDMPARRYMKMNQFINEVELRMTAKESSEIDKICIEAANQGQLVDVVRLLSARVERQTQFIETDTYYRLYSCVFFTLDEDLQDYDYDLNEEKIKEFKKEPISSFFFNAPMKRYLPQVDISDTDLEIYLAKTKMDSEVLEKIRLDVQGKLN